MHPHYELAAGAGSEELASLAERVCCTHLGLVPAGDVFPSFCSTGDAINRWSSFSEIRHTVGARHQTSAQQTGPVAAPPRKRPPVAAPPPLQRWRYWVMGLVVVIAALVLFRVDGTGARPSTSATQALSAR